MARIKSLIRKKRLEKNISFLVSLSLLIQNHLSVIEPYYFELNIDHQIGPIILWDKNLEIFFFNLIILRRYLIFTNLLTMFVE